MDNEGEQGLGEKESSSVPVASTVAEVPSAMPSGTSTEATPSPLTETQTVSDFYRGIASNVTPDTQDRILKESSEIQALEKRLESMKTARNVNVRNQEKVGFLNFQAKGELRGEAKRLEENINSDLRQKNEAIGEMKNLTSVASELNSNIASPETIARTINPVRLETLAKANEPLPGQEAQVRMVDSTPEQIAQRRLHVEQQRSTRLSGESTVIQLPEDHISETQKQIDIENHAKEYARQSVEKLATRLLSQIQMFNERTRKDGTPYEQYKLSAEAIVEFSNMAYAESSAERAFLIEDMEKGFSGLMDEARSIEGKYNAYQPIPLEERNQADYLKERAKQVEVVERKAMVLMSMWQMASEVSVASGSDEIQPKEFAHKVKIIEDNWVLQEGRYGYYMGKSSSYRAINGGAFEGMSSNYVEGIAQDIVEKSGKRSVKELDSRDISTAFAYLTVGLYKGSQPVDLNGLVVGTELPIRYILHNTSKTESKGRNFDSFIRKLRPGLEVPFERKAGLADILKTYGAQFNNARAFEIQSSISAMYR
ncbi:MAG: hypothetical protein AB9915_02430 [Candidatus Dojkabacteria bacterium]